MLQKMGMARTDLQRPVSLNLAPALAASVHIGDIVPRSASHPCRTLRLV